MSYVIVATYDNTAPECWGPYPTREQAVTDQIYLELTVFARHEHFVDSHVRAMALPLQPRKTETAVIAPPPPLPAPTPALRRRQYRRSDNFNLVTAGDYVWKIGHGHIGRVRKTGRGQWTAYVMNGDEIARTDKGTICAGVFNSKAAAEIFCRDRASEITYETYNMLNKGAGTFRMPITTPYCCDPSSETYHCM